MVAIPCHDVETETSADPLSTEIFRIRIVAGSFHCRRNARGGLLGRGRHAATDVGLGAMEERLPAGADEPAIGLLQAWRYGEAALSWG